LVLVVTLATSLKTVDPFNQRVMAFKNDDASALEDSPENWSAEKVRAAAEMFQREDKRQQDRAVTGQNGTDFVALHPEYVDSDANGQLMNHQLKTMFGDCLHTPEHFEAADQALRSSNFLAHNKAEVAKQEKAAAKARAEEERARRAARAFNEDSAYGSLSMDELRQRADEQLRQQMQRRAEEGGW
jgi:hypothetical protein